jgi:hypothetical protein
VPGCATTLPANSAAVHGSTPHHYGMQDETLIMALSSGPAMVAVLAGHTQPAHSKTNRWCIPSAGCTMTVPRQCCAIHRVMHPLTGARAAAVRLIATTTMPTNDFCTLPTKRCITCVPATAHALQRPSAADNHRQGRRAWCHTATPLHTAHASLVAPATVVGNRPSRSCGSKYHAPVPLGTIPK